MESTQKSSSPRTRHTTTTNRSTKRAVRGKPSGSKPRPPVYVVYATLAEALTGEAAGGKASDELKADRRRILGEVMPVLGQVHESLLARVAAREPTVTAATATTARERDPVLIADHSDRDAAGHVHAAMIMLCRAVSGPPLTLSELLAAKTGLDARYPEVYDHLGELERRLGGVNASEDATAAMRRVWLTVAYALGAVAHEDAPGGFCAVDGDFLSLAAARALRERGDRHGGAS